VALCGRYQSESGWYRGAELRGVAAGYYLALRKAILRDPTLRGVLHRCFDCRIYFLSYWSNPRSIRGEGLRCPMGCSRGHRDRESRKRSAEYYRTPEGKQKKRELNRRRSESGRGPHPVAADPRKLERCLLAYLGFILERVDRRRVCTRDVERLFDEISQILRQHGLAEWRWLWQSRDG
jgi:hypothetical protein